MVKLVKKSFPVTGMSCASCALNVEDTIKNQRGVSQASVNFAASSLWVEYDPEKGDELLFKKALQSAGYDLITGNVTHLQREEIAAGEMRRLKKDTLWATLLTIPVVITGMFLMNWKQAGIFMLLLTTPVVFIAGKRFFINAAKLLKHGKTSMDTLVALSTGIAYLYSLFNLIYPQISAVQGGHHMIYFETASVIITFILLGRYLEERAKSGTSSAIEKLMGLQPDFVTLIDDAGNETGIPLAAVRTGNNLRIKPGDRIPVDGVVMSGVSFIDESSITGESMPAEKKAGDTVYAGTLNQNGSLVILARGVGEETLLSRIIRVVEEARGSKPPVQKMVDRVASVFVPVVISIAFLSFLIWMVAGGENTFQQALTAMVSVLLIACPCALGLATPTAIMVGIGKGASHGILIKDAEGLERACKTDTVVFDKTGTVTEGSPAVTDLIWLKETDTEAAILLGMEMQSEHPLAVAVVRHIQSAALKPLMPDSFESITGKGVRAVYGGKIYLAGNEQIISDHDILLPDPVASVVTELQLQAKTVVIFAGGNEVLAVAAIADQMRPSAAEAVIKLKEQHRHVVMLTGDNEKTARAVASMAGIDDYRAGLLPGDKSAIIAGFQKEGRVVAMVGDGINDSEAMAVADVSIAMGKGADIAMEVAQMTIVSSDLNLIPGAIKLSDLTIRTVRQNLFWAFIYNLTGIPLAAGVFYPFTGYMLSPVIAGAAMALSSVSVVSNSLRLKYKKM